ncbi:MAG: aminotransferase class V-fold PLP-dependent enzyme [bacterium]|nr:aminotransferase class V-fold PLP-dependent enzyme [bacterium]
MSLDLRYLRTHEFPLTAECAFLNHAASSPLPRRSADALRHYADHAQRKHLRYKAGAPDHDCGPLRRTLADVIKCDPSEITFVPSTCDGVAIAAGGIDWKPGDNVVLPECEYPGAVYPWLNLIRRGVEVRMMPAPNGLVDVDALLGRIDGRTRAVSVSHVEWSSGYLVDVGRIGQVTRPRGILLVVDAIQSLGVTPVDVQQMQADVLVAGCYKMLLGIPGAAVFYVRRDVMPRLLPDRAGQESVQTPMLAQPDLVWKDDAMRYQVGSDCTAALVVLESSLELLLESGVEQTHSHILALLDRLIPGLQRLGLTITSALAPGTRSTILSFATGDAARDEALHKRLLEQSVILSLRPHGLRVAPHLYNASEDIDRLVAALNAA